MNRYSYRWFYRTIEVPSTGHFESNVYFLDDDQMLNVLNSEKNRIEHHDYLLFELTADGKKSERKDLIEKVKKLN